MSVGGDPRASTTLVVGVIGGILLLAFVMLAQVLFYNVQRDEEERKRIAPRPRELTELQYQQVARINEYRYVSEPAGIVAVPIDRAIELFVAGRKAVPPATTMSVAEPTTAPAEGEGPTTKQGTRP